MDLKFWNGSKKGEFTSLRIVMLSGALDQKSVACAFELGAEYCRSKNNQKIRTEFRTEASSRFTPRR